jgi:hypothetical protein
MIQPVTTPAPHRQAPGLLARLGLRGQLYASFAAISLLLTAVAIGAVAWTHHSDTAAGLMLAAAGEVSGQASHLANEVGRFAQSVRAA